MSANDKKRSLFKMLPATDNILEHLKDDHTLENIPKSVIVNSIRLITINLRDSIKNDVDNVCESDLLNSVVIEKVKSAWLELGDEVRAAKTEQERLYLKGILRRPPPPKPKPTWSPPPPKPKHTRTRNFDYWETFWGKPRAQYRNRNSWSRRKAYSSTVVNPREPKMSASEKEKLLNFWPEDLRELLYEID